MNNALTLDDELDGLVEYKYQLRVEHNHSDMTWYAYYAGKGLRQLFDKDVDWYTASNTPSGAVSNLVKLVHEKDRDSL
jgi:uncharacterized protein (DUF3820 family)